MGLQQQVVLSDANHREAFPWLDSVVRPLQARKNNAHDPPRAQDFLNFPHILIGVFTLMSGNQISSSSHRHRQLRRVHGLRR